jgi:hypothetical protein
MVVLAIISAPGAGDVLGDVGDWARDNPLPVILGALAVLFLLLAYWDQLLSAVGVRTVSSLQRQMRDWLDTQHYTVQVKPGPDGNNYFSVQAPEDPINLTIIVVNGPPRRVDVIGGATFGEEHAQAIAPHATPAMMRGFRIELHRIVLGQPRVSLGIEHADDPVQFRSLFISHLFADDFGLDQFLRAMHTVRMCVSVALLVIGDAALTIIEERGGTSAAPSDAAAVPVDPTEEDSP